MAWVVDACLVIDVVDDDPEFGPVAARLLDAKAGEGFVVCPVSYVELAPAFLGEESRQDRFLAAVGVCHDVPWCCGDTLLAHKAWASYVAARRREGLPRRPIADVLIGALALGQGGLLTRSPLYISGVFPGLSIVVPYDGP